MKDLSENIHNFQCPSFIVSTSVAIYYIFNVRGLMKVQVFYEIGHFARAEGYSEGEDR